MTDVTIKRELLEDLREAAYELYLIHRNDHNESPADCKRVKMADAALAAPADTRLVEALDELLDLVSRQRDFNDDGDGMTVQRAEAALAAAKEQSHE